MTVIDLLQASAIGLRLRPYRLELAIHTRPNGLDVVQVLGKYGVVTEIELGSDPIRQMHAWISGYAAGFVDGQHEGKNQ